MGVLYRKLGRDLWRMKGQASAIALVIAVGVMLQVMMTGLVVSLDETRKAYYERYRLAEVFAPLTRAPNAVMSRIRAIDGVANAESRVVGAALLDMEGEALPVQAAVVSLPDFGAPLLNDIYLTSGRRLDGDRTNEVLLLESFARAHDIRPGDSLPATIYGAKRTFKIVGLVQSPEFLYITAPGEVVPDDSRFGVIWTRRATLEAAFDMQGAFNEVILSLGFGANEQAVIADLDRVLSRYGGVGAYAIDDLFSNRFVSEEIAGLRRMSGSIPPLFMAIAAFLLYIVVSRMVQSEREEIGLMKAFGYTDIEVGAHYFRLVIVIAMGGALLGALFGIASGRAMVDLYLEYFKFPFLIFRLDPASFVVGIGLSVLSASAGGLLVLRGVFALTPAVAMRPPAPADYSTKGRLTQAVAGFFDQPTRMVLRRLIRQPGRMAGAVVGIACGVALSASMASLLASFEDMLQISFSDVDRSDVTVSFIHPLHGRTAYEIARIPGVIEVEPVRYVAAIIRHGTQSYNGAVSGMVENPRLYRALDANRQDIVMRKDGIILGAGLAKTLNARAGDLITLDIREGRQPRFEVRVSQVAQSLLGSPAYMEKETLNRALGETGQISGMYLRIDTGRSDAIFKTLKDMPMVAGVSLKADSERAFRTIIDEGAGMMRYVMAAIAGIITFGIVYNAARVAQSERAQDLASLRVLGFSRAEVSFVLLGELASVVLLALPLGGVLGYYLSFAIAAGFSTDIYQIPGNFSLESFGTSVIVVILAALVSGWLVRRNIDRVDLVAALKSRE